jgi:ABC-2 type transport system permease protein
MKRNGKLLLTLAKMRLSHLMVFRLSFFGAFFVDGSMFLIQLLLFDVLFGQVEAIGGWYKAEMTIFVGTFSLVNALNMSTFFFGLITIPDKIRTGALDLYIVKPGNPLLRLSFERMDPGSLPLIALSLAIILRGVSLLPAPPSLFAVGGYILLVLLMTLLWYDLMLLVRTVPFFVLSEILLGLGVVHFIGVLFTPLMRPLFNVPGEGAFVLSMGLAAGYPMDAVITSRFRKGGMCTQAEGERMVESIWFCMDTARPF